MSQIITEKCTRVKCHNIGCAEGHRDTCFQLTHCNWKFRNFATPSSVIRLWFSITVIGDVEVLHKSTRVVTMTMGDCVQHLTKNGCHTTIRLYISARYKRKKKRGTVRYRSSCHMSQGWELRMLCDCGEVSRWACMHSAPRLGVLRHSLPSHDTTTFMCDSAARDAQHLAALAQLKRQRQGFMERTACSFAFHTTVTSTDSTLFSHQKTSNRQLTSDRLFLEIHQHALTHASACSEFGL